MFYIQLRILKHTLSYSMVSLCLMSCTSVCNVKTVEYSLWDDLKLSFSFNTLKNWTALYLILCSHMKLTVDVYIRVTVITQNSYITLSFSCYSEYDLCPLLDDFNATNCPPQLLRENFPCMCNFHTGSYSLTNENFKIPELPSLLSWLTAVCLPNNGFLYL